MAKIQRILHKTFGGSGSSDNFAKFGSLVAGSPLKTKDILTIQSLPAWDNGFQDALYGGNKDILLQDLNACLFEHSRQVAYIFQAGIAEWDVSTTYYIGSKVSDIASGDVYVSLQDNNTGNALPGHAGNAFWAWWNPSGPGSGLDADTVDGLHASATPVAGKLLALDGTGKFPTSVVAGAVVQSKINEGNTFQTINQVISQDDTIPQSTEGTELITVSITPQAIGNKLRVRVLIPYATSSSNGFIAALFRDADTDAMAATISYSAAGVAVGYAEIVHEVLAGSLAATTFKARVGVTAGSAGICGAGSRLFGGVYRYSIEVEEIAA